MKKPRAVEFLMSEDGQYPLVVARPRDPELNLKLGYQALEQNSTVDFQKILDQQEFTIVGFAIRKRSRLLKKKVEVWIADTDGNLIEKCKSGDSIVSGPNFEKPRCFAESESTAQ